MTDAPAWPVSITWPGQLASLADLAAIPEEEVWLAFQKSAGTRRAYRQDVAHFMRTLGITAPDQLRQVDHRAVIACERIMREEKSAAASTVRRRLAAALSSLFKPWCGMASPAVIPWRTWRGRASTARRHHGRLLEGRGQEAARCPCPRYPGRGARPGDPLRRIAGGVTPGGDRRA